MIQKIVESGGSIGHLIEDSSEIILSWPSFLECLGLRSLLKNFPEFNGQNEFFSLVKSIVSSTSDRDLLIHLYDQIFIECLTQVKEVLEIDPNFLISQIQKRKEDFPFSQSFDQYEKLFTEKPYETIHDLIFYLAWDRMCVCLASLFDEGNSDFRLFKECLVESFHHITLQGKTTPGLFRLVESLYAYYLRDENIQMHTDTEWLILSKGSKVLQPREELISIPYIDCFITSCQESGKIRGRVLTLDSVDAVKSGLSLAQCIIQKLKIENKDWQHFLAPIEIICLKKSENSFEVDSIISSFF